MYIIPVYVDIIISKDTLNKYGYLIKQYYGMSIRGVLLLQRSRYSHWTAQHKSFTSTIYTVLSYMHNYQLLNDAL